MTYKKIIINDLSITYSFLDTIYIIKPGKIFFYKRSSKRLLSKGLSPIKMILYDFHKRSQKDP